MRVNFNDDVINFPDTMGGDEISDVLGALWASTQAVSEFAATLATGAIAEPLAGLAGIGSTIYSSEEGAGARTVQSVRDALTYQPRTRAGQLAMQSIAKDVSRLAQVTGAEHLSGYWRDRVVPALQEQAGPISGSVLAAGGLGLIAAFGEMSPGRILPVGRQAGAIQAFHGSPHSFDEFSMDKLGTGEGAQAYGHGLYFAESEDVALGYRDALTDSILVDGKPISNMTNDYAEMTLLNSNFDIDKAITASEGHLADLDTSTAIGKIKSKGINKGLEKLKGIKARDSIKTQEGSMYQVDIDADPDEFLDWDLPLSQQSEGVRKAIGDMGAGSNDPDLARRIGVLEAKIAKDPSLEEAYRPRINKIKGEVSTEDMLGEQILTKIGTDESYKISAASKRAREISEEIKGITGMSNHLNIEVARQAFPDNIKEIESLYSQLDEQGRILKSTPASLTSERLNQSGVKGIRYKDGMSRGAGGLIDNRGTTVSSNTISNDIIEQASRDGLGAIDSNNAADGWMAAMSGDTSVPGYESIKKVIDAKGYRLNEGTSNYVIFDDRLISISKKYGITIPAAAAMLNGGSQEDSI